MDNSSNFISAGDFLKQTWQLYKERFSVLVVISLLPAVISLIIELLTLDEANSMSLSPIIIVITLIAIIVTMWSQAASLLAIRDGNAHTAVDYYKQGSSKLFILIISSILSGLAVLGGLILLIIPGIIFSVWFMFSAYFVVLENKKAVESLKASKAIVKGLTGKVLWKVIILILVYGVAYIVFMFLGVGVSAVAGDVGLAIIAAITSAILTPFGFVAGYMLYTYLKTHPVPTKTITPSSTPTV